jgi:hypothetical protein
MKCPVFQFLQILKIHYFFITNICCNIFKEYLQICSEVVISKITISLTSNHNKYLYNCTRRSVLLSLFILTPSSIKPGPFTLRIRTHRHLHLSVVTSSRMVSKNAGNDYGTSWYVTAYPLHRNSRAFQFQIYRPLYKTKKKLNVERIFFCVHKVNFHYTKWVCELGSVQHLSERVF